MHGIGNDHDAQTILFWVRSHGRDDWGRPSCIRKGEAPEGWEFLGSGSYRSVWLSPDGVAYKVNHSTWDDQSEDELSALRKVWDRQADLPAMCRVPRFERYEVDSEPVVAVEHVKGKTLSDAQYSNEIDRAEYKLHWEHLRMFENRFKLWDMHGENAMIDSETGDLVVVDLGG